MLFVWTSYPRTLWLPLKKTKKTSFFVSLPHEHLSSLTPRSRERAFCKVAAASGLVSILPQVRKHHGATPAFRLTGYAELLKGICEGARRRRRLASFFFCFIPFCLTLLISEDTRCVSLSIFSRSVEEIPLKTRLHAHTACLFGIPKAWGLLKYSRDASTTTNEQVPGEVF